jgi:hypothetical protein
MFQWTAPDPGPPPQWYVIQGAGRFFLGATDRLLVQARDSGHLTRAAH